MLRRSLLSQKPDLHIELHLLSHPTTHETNRLSKPKQGSLLEPQDVNAVILIHRHLIECRLTGKTIVLLVRPIGVSLNVSHREDSSIQYNSACEYGEKGLSEIYSL